jgi:hypothetical protein
MLGAGTANAGQILATQQILAIRAGPAAAAWEPMQAAIPELARGQQQEKGIRRPLGKNSAGAIFAARAGRDA